MSTIHTTGRVHPHEHVAEALRCLRCASSYPIWSGTVQCTCGSPLAWQGTPGDDGAGPGVWRYGGLLPPVTAAHRLSLGEAPTPLLTVDDRRAKLDYLLPTGSFKDRGAAVLVSCAVESGATRAVADSSGNAGAALAAYFALAGIPLRVYVPAEASSQKIAQARRYGAEVVEVVGSREEASVEARRHAATHAAYYASHAWSPFFVAGVRTLAAELADELGDAPEAIVVPVGAGTLLLGLHEGFSILRDRGATTRLPRVFGVQATPCAPLARAFAHGSEDVDDATATWRPSIAEGINTVRAPRARAILAAVRETSGAVIAVDESSIVGARDRLALGGMLVETTSATAWAGADHLERRGLVEHPLVVLTGSGLKERL